MRLTTQLAEMRDAAMKLGQILSMDTGDLPQELADILATLRNAGYAMPDAQLQEVLADGLGPNFEKKLKGFESRPFAAASIGQVHRLSTRDGRAAVSKYSTRVLEKVSILTSITSLHYYAYPGCCPSTWICPRC